MIRKCKINKSNKITFNEYALILTPASSILTVDSAPKLLSYSPRRDSVAEENSAFIEKPVENKNITFNLEEKKIKQSKPKTAKPKSRLKPTPKASSEDKNKNNKSSSVQRAQVAQQLKKIKPIKDSVLLNKSKSKPKPASAVPKNTKIKSSPLRKSPTAKDKSSPLRKSPGIKDKSTLVKKPMIKNLNTTKISKINKVPKKKTHRKSTSVIHQEDNSVKKPIKKVSIYSKLKEKSNQTPSKSRIETPNKGKPKKRAKRGSVVIENKLKIDDSNKIPTKSKVKKVKREQL